MSKITRQIWQKTSLGFPLRNEILRKPKKASETKIFPNCKIDIKKYLPSDK